MICVKQYGTRIQCSEGDEYCAGELEVVWSTPGESWRVMCRWFPSTMVIIEKHWYQNGP